MEGREVRVDMCLSVANSKWMARNGREGWRMARSFSFLFSSCMECGLRGGSVKGVGSFT